MNVHNSNMLPLTIFEDSYFFRFLYFPKNLSDTTLLFFSDSSTTNEVLSCDIVGASFLALLMALFWYWTELSPASKPRYSQMPWWFYGQMPW